MDKFKEEESKKGNILKNSWYDWYNWLFKYIPKSLNKQQVNFLIRTKLQAAEENN